MSFNPTKEMPVILAENPIQSSEMATYFTELEAYIEANDLNNAAELLADTTLTYTPGEAGTVESGDIVRTLDEGFSYSVAASGASDHHIVTAGGVKLYVLPPYNVKAFGAVGDWDGTDSTTGTGTDDTTALQKAFDVSVAQGSQLFFPNGRYRTTAPLVLDRSGNSDDPINGAMFGCSIVGGGPASAQIVADHDEECIEFLGGADAGWHTYLNIDGVGLLKADYDRAVGSVGLSLSECAYFIIRNFDAYGFEYGAKGVDVLSGSFVDGTFRGNAHGFDFRRGSRSDPNNISFRNVKTLNNFITGGTIIQPSVFSYIGGSIESNGFTGTLADTNSWGLYVENAGAEGAVGINLQGVYIEGNNGVADISITQTANNVIHNLNGCSFLRFQNTRYTTYGVLFNSTNDSRVSVSGCGFKDTSSYTSDPSRPFIGAGVGKILDGGGNLFVDSSGGYVGLFGAVFSHIGVNTVLLFSSPSHAAKNI